jgi:hypothetical protein
MFPPLRESVGLRAKKARRGVVDEDRGPLSRRLPQERNHLCRTWLPSAQKGGLVLARAFNELEACRWILIHVAGTLRGARRGLG